jgi:hypothetical protein
MNANIKAIEDRIARIKRELLRIGPMRPGSLTRQKRSPKYKGRYYQLSYTHKMRGYTEYTRPEFVADLRRQIAEYKKFKKLTGEWISLAIAQSKLTITSQKRSALPRPKTRHS